MDPYIERVASRERLRARAHLRRLVNQTRKEYGMPTKLQEDMRLLGQKLARMRRSFAVRPYDPHYRSPHWTPGAVDVTALPTPARGGASDADTPGPQSPPT